MNDKDRKIANSVFVNASIVACPQSVISESLG